MPTARWVLSTGVINNVLYAMGGANTIGALGANEAFTPAPTNQPPVAVLPPDQTVECASHSGTSVTIDGSGSSDPDHDTLTFAWSVDGAPATGATSSSLTETFPLGAHTIQLTVTDPGGLTSSATTHVTVVDTTPPTLTLSQSSLTVVLPTATATGVGSSTLNLNQYASATDTCDPSPIVTNNAPSILPIGITQITFTATDHSGNSTQKAFMVQVVYNFIGYFVPILNNGGSIFQSGRTVPVKFQLTAADTTIVSNAVATLSVIPYAAFVVGSTDFTDATSSGGADTGNLFRFDPTSGQYMFNLSTSGFATGTWLLRATLNDGTHHDVLISMR